MLGLSDRGAIRALLGLILAGDAQGALAALRDQYDLGVEPSAVLRGLLEAVHGITRAKVGGAQRSGPVGRGARGLCRLGGQARPCRDPPALAAAAEGPRRGPQRADAARGRRNGAAARHPRRRAARSRRGAREAGERRGRRRAAPPRRPRPRSQGALLKVPADFPALVELLAGGGKAHLAQQLHDFVGLVRYAPPELVHPARRSRCRASSSAISPRR